MKSPLAILQQLTHKDEFKVSQQEQTYHRELQDKRTKIIKKYKVQQSQSGKRCTQKLKRPSQFLRTKHDVSTDNSSSPLHFSNQSVTSDEDNTPNTKRTYRGPQKKNSSPLLKLYKISSEQSSKSQQPESETSTNYDDDSQLIDESMRSVSSSSFLIGTDDKEIPEEIRNLQNNTQDNQNLMMSENVSHSYGGQNLIKKQNNQCDILTTTFSQSFSQQLNSNDQISQLQLNQNTQCTQAFEIPMDFQVKPVFFLPGVPTTQKILNGESIIFKDHYKEILMYYDIIPVSRSFIEGATIPGNGVFFEVKPSDQDQFWAQKCQQFPKLANFINKHNNS